jgi:hypothetical protein
MQTKSGGSGDPDKGDAHPLCNSSKEENVSTTQRVYHQFVGNRMGNCPDCDDGADQREAY